MLLVHVRRADDRASHAMRGQRPQHLRLALAVMKGGRHEQAVSRPPSGVFNAAHDFAQKGVGDIGHHNAQGA